MSSFAMKAMLWGIMPRNSTLQFALLVLLSATKAFCEPADRFLCDGKWDGKSEARWEFESDGGGLTVRLTPNRCFFSLGKEFLGWGELLPSLPDKPTTVSVVRDKFRWLLFVGRRLIAFAFADLPRTVKATGIGDEGFRYFPKISELFIAPLGWEQLELEDKSLAYYPKSEDDKFAFPLMATLPSLTDFSVSMDVQLNGARSVGIGFCWGEDGGYLWRWVRKGYQTFWRLEMARPSNSAWELKTLYEEIADTPLTIWRRLQVWRSLDQIWVGIDGEVMAQVRDNSFGQGQIVVWCEIGDLPLPLIKPIRINRWWCASLLPDIDTFSPFPALLGRWVSKHGVWLLNVLTRDKPAVALLGDLEMPAWWVADVQWCEELLGLVFGWVDEKNYNLFRLKPLKNSPKGLLKRAVLEIVAVRDGRERPLDRWPLLLEKSGLYRMALRIDERGVLGSINGLGLVSAKINATGKVGLWTGSSLALKGFWLYKGEEPLFALIPEEGGFIYPLGEISFASHESVVINLPAGLPPNVPLSARLSKVPIMMLVERRGDRLIFRVEKQGQLLGIAETRMPKQPPIDIRLERIDNLVLVKIGEHPVWTVRLD